MRLLCSLVLVAVATGAFAQEGKYKSTTPVVQDAKWAQKWWMPRHKEKLERVKKGNCDLLMVGGAAELPEGLPLAPLLDPAGVARLGGTGWLNTDDRPRVEFRAPRYLHYDTARANARLIEAAQRGSDKQVK